MKPSIRNRPSVSALVFAVVISSWPLAGAAVSSGSDRPLAAKAAMARHLAWLAVYISCSDPAKHLSPPIGENDLRTGAWPDPDTVTKLEVTEVRWDLAQRAWRFRMRCQPRSACLPFLVFAEPAGLPGAAALPPNGQSFCGQSAPAPFTAHSPQSASPALVHPGMRVFLVTRYPDMRLTQPADSLDRGGLGETVRVRLITSGRILPATVVAAGLTENTAE